MKFIKKNASTIVAIAVFIIVLLLIFVIKDLFISDESSAIYGSRLEGRSNVEISSSTISDVKEKLNGYTSYSKVRISGRTIEIIFTVNDDTSLDAAKELGSKALEAFSSKEKEYYDIQVFISNEKNTSQFPIIGYKQHTKDNLTWTKDRAES
jgi:hypothetical protein